jgi:hypothetical protein
VGLFEWHAYLVKLVENWWYPFRHNKKNSNYREAAIDQSFWHIYPEEIGKLEPEDRDNPIWNENTAVPTVRPKERQNTSDTDLHANTVITLI